MTKQAKQSAEAAAEEFFGLEKFNAALAAGTVEELYTDGKVIDAVLDDIDRIARHTPVDLTTARGRKSVASTAHKVARSKTYLDDIGKALVAEWKAKSALVDATRRKIRDRLDGLKADIRKPLDEWEKTEGERVKRCEDELERIRDAVRRLSTVETLDEVDEILESVRGSFLHDEEDFGEKAAHWAKVATDYQPEAAARIRAAAERAAAEAAAAAERARVNAEIEAQRAELVKLRAAMDAEREELARMRRDLMEQRAKIEVTRADVPADETDPADVPPADPIFDSGEPIEWTGGNPEEPPAEVWDESDSVQAITPRPRPPRPVPLPVPNMTPVGTPAAAGASMSITSRDHVVLLDPETGTPEVDHVGPDRIASMAFKGDEFFRRIASMDNDILAGEHARKMVQTLGRSAILEPVERSARLAAVVRELADIATDAYTATIRMGGFPPELMPYLVRLNGAVYRGYDAIGHKPAEIQVGALAPKGGAE